MSSKLSWPRSILGHLDTFFALDHQHRSFLEESSRGHCDYARMQKVNANFAIFAIYPSMSQYNIISGLDYWFNLLTTYSSSMYHVKNLEDFDNGRTPSKLGAILHTEGAGGYDSEFQLLRLAARLGLRSTGLTHANANRYATGFFFWGEQQERGLTSEGVAFLHEAQQLGITIDVSHLNDLSFWDVIEHTERPILATHSNARSICPSGRNLTDKQIIAIRDNHGVIGLNFGTVFLDPDQNRERVDLPMQLIAQHLDHIVELAGVDTIALGTDYDGTSVPKCVDSCEKLADFYTYLLDHGYSSQDLEKITYGNFYRVFQHTWL